VVLLKFLTKLRLARNRGAGSERQSDGPLRVGEVVAIAQEGGGCGLADEMGAGNDPCGGHRERHLRGTEERRTLEACTLGGGLGHT